MLCAKLSPELNAIETLEVGLSVALPKEQPDTVKKAARGKGS